MAKYYSTRPSYTASAIESTINSTAEATVLSEFDKHCERLIADDADEGWASELCRYIGSMQRDVKKDTDIVQWWQVSNFH
jgi:hypothetical protein